MDTSSSTYELIDHTAHTPDHLQRLAYVNDDEPLCSETPSFKQSATKYDEASSSSEVLKDLYDKRLSRSRTLLVAVLLLVVVVFQLVIIWKTIWLSGKDSALTNSSRLLYTTGVTILASIISAVAVNQIKTMWLVHVLQRDRHNAHQIQQVKVLLGIAESQDWLRAFWLSGLLLVFGLITAAITGSTAITVVERAYSGLGFLFLANEDILAADTYTSPRPNYTSDCYNLTSTPPNTSVLTWEISSPSTVAYITPRQDFYGSSCVPAIYRALSNLDAIFTSSYTGHEQHGNMCHHNLGGDLSCSALGAPLALEPNCNIFRPFDCEQGVSNSACVPVFHASPVSCRAGGSIATENGKILAVSGAACSKASVVTQLNDHEVVSYCPTKDAIGDMSFVLGTNNRCSSLMLECLLSKKGGTCPDALPAAGCSILSSETSILSNGNNILSNGTSIECTISLNSTMQFTRVTNTTWTDIGIEATYAAINGTETCDPDFNHNISQIVNNQARLAAAIFLSEMFNQTSFGAVFRGSVAIESGSGADGDLVTPATVFTGSANSLEDFLGVQIGSAMSYYFGRDYDLNYTRQYTIYADRVGPGTPIAVLYVLPALCALLVLIWLDWI